MNASKKPQASPDDLRASATRRRDAARHLLKPHQLRESMTVTVQPSIRNASLAGLQAALTAAIALPLIHVSPWPDLIGFAALGALVALFGRFTPQAGRGRILALCALSQTLAVLTMSAAVWLGLPLYGQFILLALGCGVFFFVAITGQFGPPGALIFVFAASAAIGLPVSWQDIIERTAATAIVAALAWLVCTVTEFLRQHATDDAPFPVEPVRPTSHRLIAAARMTLGALIAIFAAHAIGAEHAAWAAMGTMAVMQGAHLHISMNRALQRMAGTIVGACLVWLILIQEPSVWTVIGVLVVLQFTTEVIIGMNYALGQILVTPMALLMSYIVAPSADSTAMAPERVIDTVLGVAIGIILAVIFSTLDDRTHLAHLRAARDDR